MGLVTPEQQQVLSSGVASFLQQQGSEPAGDLTKPKSYLNWLLLDEQLNPVITSDGQNSGFEQVGADQQLTLHQVTQRPITKNGYLYIYLSNESPDQDVFFDNLQVTHIKGPLLEETHYYPFGLTMQGISSKALSFGGSENKYKYNGGSELQSKEFSDGSGLETYDTHFRQLDPCIGRWWQIDPKPNDAESPYASMGNNPISHNDLLGDTLGPIGNAIYDFFHGKGEGDQYGSMKSATRRDFEISPVRAFLKDAGFFVGEATGLNSIDNNSAALVDPNKSTVEKVQAAIGIILTSSPGEGPGEKAPFPENANVVRGGLSTQENIAKGTGTHPEGVTGISVECGTCSVSELTQNIPHNQIRTTTVGEVRVAGGDVIKTSGKSPNHATLTGLDPFKINELFKPPVKNPSKP